MKATVTGVFKYVALFVIFAAFSAFFLWAFYERFYRYKHCIDALKNSSCVVMSGGNLTGGGAIWSIFSLLLAVFSLVFLMLAICRHRRIAAARRHQEWRGIRRKPCRLAGYRLVQRDAGSSLCG